ncbi:cytochrome b [Microvirga flavescens]|uniref:cytochrome b n=1 Tax=Microvirga flavescens TaxID=2249811 RepID=UPI001FE1B354|nr:cytochrome b [Microvirga flavescens]
MQRYSKLMIAIHWATALLILGAWITSEGGRAVRANPPLLHFSLGLAVLALVVPRLISRLLGGAPSAEAGQRPLLAWGAKAGHAALYVFIIGLPLTGWYAASRMGVPVSFFGIGLPALTGAVQGSPGIVAELHESGGTIILFLAGLHALMALWHHFVLHDATLRRMSPFSG